MPDRQDAAPVNEAAEREQTREPYEPPQLRREGSLVEVTRLEEEFSGSGVSGAVFF